jgi:hypothetical protein
MDVIGIPVSILHSGDRSVWGRAQRPVPVPARSLAPVPSLVRLK